ncbi:MAG: PKD domain-containing protein, partial [Methanoregula sp.]|nr:PKD domain-containing protein [Methanoregula sp.]
MLLISACIFLIIVLITSIAPSSATGIETLISTGTSTSNQYSPSTWGDYIVWEDQRNGGSFIYLYNIATGDERQISSLTSSAHSPRIQGNSVVWYESNTQGSDIYLYNIPSGITTRVTNYPAEKTLPSVYGSKIIWQEQIFYDEFGTGYYYYDIILYDHSSGSFQNVTPDHGPGLTPSVSHEAPSIWGDVVVWQDWDDTRGEYELFMNDTSSLTVTRISDNGVSFSTQNNPSMSGSTIVWMDDRSGDWDIYSYDITHPIDTPLANNAGSDQKNPAIFGNNVVWLDNRGHSGYYSLGLYNLSTSTETFPVSSDSVRVADSQMPGIYGNRIVWEDNRAGLKDIYLYTNGETAPCPTASFTQDINVGSAPLRVQFSDSSSGTPAHWHWNFGDGNTSTSQSPAHTYVFSGTFPVTLTTGSYYCRNMTKIGSAQNISVGAAPIAGFSGTPVSGMVPLTVSFTDSSSGSPVVWNWSFGDGTFSESQNPSHSYTSGGTYSVRLNATNAIGTGSITRPGYITATTGAHEVAFTNITGITVRSYGTGQKLVYDTGILSSYHLSDNQHLTSSPPVSYGWQNVSFFSDDGIGFIAYPANITGNISTVFLTTKDIRPSGFSSVVGNNVEFNYLTEYPDYISPAFLTTDAWEGTVPSDNTDFRNVIYHANFASMNVSYTISTTRNGLGNPSNATINLSVGSSWLAGSEGIEWGKEHSYVIATGYDSAGNRIGTVLPASFIFNNTGTHLEYFKADVPPNFAYLTKFALAKLSGSGNPLQLITLSVASHVSSPSDPAYSPPGNTADNSEPGGTGAGIATAPATVRNANPPQALAPPDPGKTEKIYSNAQGVITQATVLQSTDQHAQLTIGPGIVALDRTGAPLSSVSLSALSAENLPSSSLPASFTFAGMAYNFEPEGATFSP